MCVYKFVSLACIGGQQRNEITFRWRILIYFRLRVASRSTFIQINIDRDIDSLCVDLRNFFHFNDIAHLARWYFAIFWNELMLRCASKWDVVTICSGISQFQRLKAFERWDKLKNLTEWIINICFAIESGLTYIMN